MTDSIIDGIDYGPLAKMVGVWQGDKGMDVAPEPDGTEQSPYYESLTLTAAGSVTNAEQQTLAVVRYHQVVKRKSNGEVFHDEVGYWMWDANAQLVMHSLAIPRAVTLLAGGSATADAVEFTVKAKQGSEWGIAQSPFMAANATTTAFEQTIKLTDTSLEYHESTMLDIYGKSFDHTDANVLQRVV